MMPSARTEYALRALIELALQPPDATLKISHIARSQMIPQKFLEGIMSSLRRGGFVRSRRGMDGGVQLSRPPADIRVGEVVGFLEAIASQPLRGGSQTPTGEVLQSLFCTAREQTKLFLDQTSLEQLAEEVRNSSVAGVMNWDI